MVLDGMQEWHLGDEEGVGVAHMQELRIVVGRRIALKQFELAHGAHLGEDERQI